jgi:ArsR family transcriptional regulator, arsenate/arsenite/antimonite-responsive transcriptional repressor
MVGTVEAQQSWDMVQYNLHFFLDSKAKNPCATLGKLLYGNIANFPGGQVKSLLKSLKALADSNRLRLLGLLLEQPRCVCELQAALGVSQPNVSKHLRILEEAGWLEKTRQGNFINYHVAAGLAPDDHRLELLALLAPRLRADPEFRALSLKAAHLNRHILLKNSPQPPGGVCRTLGRGEAGSA